MKVIGEMTDAAGTATIPRFLEFVSGHARSVGYGEGRIKEIESALSEALANVAEFGCGKEGGNVTILCGDDNGRRFVVDIADSGKPFNMLLEADPFLSGGDPMEKRPSVRWIKKIGDVEYKRFEDRNHIVITVYPASAGTGTTLGR